MKVHGGAVRNGQEISVDRNKIPRHRRNAL